MKIFLSAVSGQFRDCRQALASDLRAMDAEVKVQEDFQQHGGGLLEKLEHYIVGCDRIIALVGDAYGAEPDEPARPAGRPRRMSGPCPAITRPARQIGPPARRDETSRRPAVRPRPSVSGSAPGPVATTSRRTDR